MCCFAVNNYCRSAKRPWDVSGWLLESPVGVCLSIQTAFWNEIPWKSRLCFDYKQKDGWPFFSQYTNQLRQADGKIMELSDVLHWHSSLFIFPTCYEICYVTLCAGICLNLFTAKYDLHWQIMFPHLILWYAIATVHTSLVARSPDPIDSWLTFTIKANHAINTVMFYFHLNKGHKETRYFRALTPPLAPCTASSHYRLFSKSR